MLGLGGNLGGPAAVVQRFGVALEVLGAGPLRDLRRAPLYRTAPILRQPDGTESRDQADYVNADFVNTVAAGRLAPRLEREGPEQVAREVLGWCKRLEAEAGRDLDATPDSPRPLDLDLLLLGTGQLDLPHLDLPQRDLPEPGAGGEAGAPWPGEIRVPHPRLRRRRFVLRPLCDLLPELLLPPDGETPAMTVREALDALDAAGAPEQRVEPLRERL